MHHLIFIIPMLFHILIAQTNNPSSSNRDVERLNQLLDSASVNENNDLEFFSYQSKYVDSSTLKRYLTSFISAKGSIASHEQNNTLVLVDNKDNIVTIKKVLNEIDSYIPQVNVEARIIELSITNDFEKDISLDFDNAKTGGNSFISSIDSILPTPGTNPNNNAGLLFSLLPTIGNSNGTPITFSAALRYLETKGKATVLSSPNITVLQGEQSNITTGEEIPIFTQTVTSGSVSTSTQFKSVGVKLRVKPITILGDRIRISINPEVSNVTRVSSGPAGTDVPVIAVRKASSILEVNENQLVSIGGLLRDETREVVRKVPILGSLPIIGWLFRNTRTETIKTQLIIFLKITIIKEKNNDIFIPGVQTNNANKFVEEIEKSLNEIEKKLKSTE